ncbi:MAG: 2-amino-4-hydroxy-6-hydroxymethyldihydropteridine diphosphokinase [Prevotella sp.]|jgi:2-amino-4-hydroxy-6-hydroxymethyldihydropteridine diphosphokinase|nr:2-amino-4-hydroxy-6-hydroxymethyldihydropteridine diphosphokinase [Prevotella sp.]
MHIVYLGLGTNLGDKKANIENAIDKISESVGTVCRRSSLFYSKPWGFESENDFINAVVCVETELSPLEVLRATQCVERSLGRTEKSVNNVYHDRLIDIDILLYDDIEISTPELTIPHPLMKQRDFVMIPLKEILK